MRYELSDYEWTAVKPLLPNRPHGVRRVNDRRTLICAVPVVDRRWATPMIHATHFMFWMPSGFLNRVWLATAISLFSCAVSAQTYPVSGVWVARDHSFLGSTAGACLLLKVLGVDAVSTQSFPSVMIFSEDKRYELRRDLHAERTIRSVKTATDGGFQIEESHGRRWLFFSTRRFMLKVVNPTTIDIIEGKISNRFFKCPRRSRHFD
jgi:hypothetical protein